MPPGKRVTEQVREVGGNPLSVVENAAAVDTAFERKVSLPNAVSYIY